MSLDKVLATAAAIFGFGASGEVEAGTYSSVYSDLDIEQCQILNEDSEFGSVSYKCDGQFGYDVYVTEGDLRFYIAHSATGEPPEGTIGQTVAPFNNLGPKLEWRFEESDGTPTPFATIVRYKYQTMNDDGTYGNGQALVVSRFRSGETCHVAYIDAFANAEANVMAREVADKYASGGECPEGRVPVLGHGGEGL